LSALLPDADSKESPPALLTLPVKDIHPNPQQPRRDFRPEELAELAASIRAKGVIQPLVVRKRSAGGYELIAGERRLRAAQMAGFTELPVRVMEVANDLEMLELSLVENLQREDLNPVELARGYARLHDDFGLTQEDIAGRVGKERATVANTLRVLELPEAILNSLRAAEISLGHAKAILMLQGAARQSALHKRVLAGRLSVRQTEEAARAMLEGVEKILKEQVTPPQTPKYAEHTERLRQRLGTQIKITKRGKKGAIRIEFYSDEDLERLMELLEK
jgi:ParB family transcriptional regulator, chromosome partitioning protein